MASVFDLITSSLDSRAVGQISQQLGQDTGTTENAINAALPMLLGAVQKSAKHDGAAGLAQALNSRHDGGILNDLSGFIAKDDQSDGAGILKHILGSKQGLAEKALEMASGVDQRQASSLLATLAPVVLGALGKTKRDSRISDDALNSVLDGEADMLEKKAPGVMGALGGFLDTDGDGDTDMSDILSRGARSLGGLFR